MRAIVPRMRWSLIFLLFLGAAGCTPAAASEPRTGSVVRPSSAPKTVAVISRAVHEARCRVSYRREIDQCRKQTGEEFESCVNAAYVDLGSCLDHL